MNVPCEKPVIMPNISGQRWSCHSCGNCCRTLVGHLFDEERERLDRQGWTETLGVASYVRVGRGWALNKREDGACVFLDQDNRCKIHARFGEEAKPFACRIFPFSLRPVPGGWQASLRFDCPSVVNSKGRPLGLHRAWLRELAGRLEPRGLPAGSTAELQRRVPASAEEIDVVLGRLCRWLKNDTLSLCDRLIGAARLTTTLVHARLKKVRGARLGELLDLLTGALPADCRRPPPAPTARQRGMLRQLAFAHAEHVTLAEMRSGLRSRLRKRWQQLGRARRFARGAGMVPRLAGFSVEVGFDAVESVALAGGDKAVVEDLLLRYLSARIESGSVFGPGYYGWPVFTGLAALWLAVAVVGWLARYAAAAEGRAEVGFADVGRAIGVVDRAATRLPALGTAAERTRVVYLLKDDGIARLLHGYAVTA